jgi:hypothetical protein
MRTVPLPALGVALALTLLASTPAAAGVPTAHRISFQGLARNASNQPVVSGDVRVRVYDAATGGTLVYDSGTEFNAAVVTGVFNVVLGSGAPLMLDNTLLYHLELDINGQEVVGDAASGRQAFWPSGGDESRSDLEGRITALEAQIFASCSGNQYDLDGNPANGCEFTLDTNGIYVDANDPSGNDNAGCGRGPNGTCPSCVPCRSIARGLTEAGSTGRTTVYVANGTYPEAVTLVNGKNLLGGYASLTWARDVAATNTMIRGESVSGAHKRAVVGTSITNPTTFSGFVVYGPIATAAGGNSYAIHLTNCGGLVLRDNVILGGIGGPGVDGAVGPNGSDGVAGASGANAIQSPGTGCTLTPRSGGAGGSLTCGGTDVSGGAGGGNLCPVTANAEASGRDGLVGVGGGGAGGDAGEDGTFNGSTCTLPTTTQVMNGANGSNGPAGSNGTAVLGAASGPGSVSAGNWVGPSAASGNIGGFGRGGGGGGAGGGADAISPAPNNDILGASGGGGGSGACGGTGGGGGSFGGGSFGVFVVGGSAPTITTNVIVRGVGGAGGRGGNGGRGGAGGFGAAGGTSGSLFCSGTGGRGGDGGAGGHGSGGGGGAGGISCGIFTSGIGSPTYGTTNTISGGTAGAGGQGGLSLGSAGGAGAAGSITSVTSQ